MKSEFRYNIDNDYLQRHRPKSAKHLLPPLPPKEKPEVVDNLPSDQQKGLWERRRLRRPLSGIAVSTSPTKKNSIDNLNAKYGGNALERCGAYEVEKKIGKGSFGKVYLVRDARGNQWAMKKIPLHQALTKYEAGCIIAEVKVASSHHSRYLLSAYDVFIAGNDLCLVTDFAAKGDLYSLIKRRRLLRMPLEEGVIWNMLLQMLLGLEYMHKYGVIHRDVKTMNIFVTKTNDILMGDFGISKIVPPWKFLGSHGSRRPYSASNARLADTIIGTPLYLSPEMVQSQKYGFKVDVWALGCVLWELMTFERAFDARNHRLLNQKILAGLCSSAIPEGRYSSDLVSLAKAMIDIDTHTRPGIDEIMKRPAVRARLEGSGLSRGDYIDANVTKRLQNVVYPPSRVADWERACDQLKCILGDSQKNTYTASREHVSVRCESPKYRPKLRGDQPSGSGAVPKRRAMPLRRRSSSDCDEEEGYAEKHEARVRQQSRHRPIVSGQRPIVSGQRSIVSGQRPIESGQRPIASAPNVRVRPLSIPNPSIEAIPPTRWGGDAAFESRPPWALNY